MAGRAARWWGLLLLGGAVVVFYAPYLARLPCGIHSWAQGDRLALALNFYDFGFQFLTPRTSSLVSRGGITGVEFPLPAYVAALGGLGFGRGAISPLFRLLDAGLALLGFYYLFRLVLDRTQHFGAALVPGCFLLASPVFAFYAGNYLPDPASLSVSFVAYYYWLRFLDQRVFRDLVCGIFLLTLAALLKTSTALYLGAVLGITFGWGFFVPVLLSARQRLAFAGLSLVAVGCVVLFFWHNRQLNSQYASSQFLASTNPIRDAKTLAAVLAAIRQKWWFQYATPLQYQLLAVGAGVGLAFAWPSRRQAGTVALTLLVLAGGGVSFVFFWLMGTQLILHDYYAICSFMPPAVLGLVLALLHLGRLGQTSPARYWASTAGLLLLCGMLLRAGYQQLQLRMQEQPYGWLRDAPALLARAGVSRQALMLVIEQAPNTPLVYIDRRGLTWNPPVKQLRVEDLVDRMSAHGLTYALLPPDYYAALAGQAAGLRAAFVPVLTQPFVVLRLRSAVAIPPADRGPATAQLTAP